jgi:hypothetical protein
VLSRTPYSYFDVAAFELEFGDVFFFEELDEFLQLF